MTDKAPCQHPYPRLELHSHDSGTAECRDCDMVTDFIIDYEGWLTADEYEERQAKEDAWWKEQQTKAGD